MIVASIFVWRARKLRGSMPALLLFLSIAPTCASAVAVDNRAVEQAAYPDNVPSLTQRIDVVERIALDQLAAERKARTVAESARARATDAQLKAERLSIEARAQSARDGAARTAAEAEAIEAQRLADEASAEADRLFDEAQQRAEEAARATKAASELKLKLATEQRNRQIAIGAGAGGILLAAAIAWLLLRRARRRSLAEIDGVRAERPDPVSDCVLIGSDQHVQLPGRQLPKAAGGVVVGRNPELATAVLNYEDVSRQHMRFFHDGQAFCAEDLDSRFGSKLDGKALPPHVPRKIVSGAVIELAEHCFEFRILG